MAASASSSETQKRHVGPREVAKRTRILQGLAGAPPSSILEEQNLTSDFAIGEPLSTRPTYCYSASGSRPRCRRCGLFAALRPDELDHTKTGDW